MSDRTGIWLVGKLWSNWQCKTWAQQLVYISHHVVEDEAGVGQFEVFDETVQLPAVQCAPRTVEVIPGLGLLPCVVVVLKLGKKETECDLSCWEATDSLIFDEEFTSRCHFSGGLNRHAAAFINPTVSHTLISALLCFAVTPHRWFLGHFISPKLTTGIPDAQEKGLPILMLMQQHKNTTSFTPSVLRCRLTLTGRIYMCPRQKIYFLLTRIRKSCWPK